MPHDLDHVSITVRRLAPARALHDAVAAALGFARAGEDGYALRYGVRSRAGDDAHACLTVSRSDAMQPDDGRRWCLRAPDPAAVDPCHAAAGRDAGAPGLRPNDHPDHFAAFLHDPDGKRIEAVGHRPA